MARKRRTLFDPKSFLAQVGDGHSIGKCDKRCLTRSSLDVGHFRSTPNQACRVA
jgi:hypothetical protein